MLFSAYMCAYLSLFKAFLLAYLNLFCAYLKYIHSICCVVFPIKYNKNGFTQFLHKTKNYLYLYKVLNYNFNLIHISIYYYFYFSEHVCIIWCRSCFERRKTQNPYKKKKKYFWEINNKYFSTHFLYLFNLFNFV